jgi:hypothetical protein
MNNEYRIVKFRQWGGPQVQTNYGTVTLKRAREICSDPKTSSNCRKPFGKNWFLGFTKA